MRRSTRSVESSRMRSCSSLACADAIKRKKTRQGRRSGWPVALFYP